MEKRRVPDSGREESDSAREQSGLSERMRQLILRSSTVDERRKMAVGDNAERRRRTDDSGADDFQS